MICTYNLPKSEHKLLQLITNYTKISKYKIYIQKSMACLKVGNRKQNFRKESL